MRRYLAMTLQSPCANSSAYTGTFDGNIEVLWNAHRREHFDRLQAAMTELYDIRTALSGIDYKSRLTSTSNSDVHTRVKKDGSTYYLIASNNAGAPQNATFTWAANVGSVPVYAESRTLTPTGAQFTDSFGAYEAHVYQITEGEVPAPFSDFAIDVEVPLDRPYRLDDGRRHHQLESRMGHAGRTAVCQRDLVPQRFQGADLVLRLLHGGQPDLDLRPLRPRMQDGLQAPGQRSDRRMGATERSSHLHLHGREPLHPGRGHDRGLRQQHRNRPVPPLGANAGRASGKHDDLLPSL